jgi:hypothetical protein
MNPAKALLGCAGLSVVLGAVAVGGVLLWASSAGGDTWPDPASVPALEIPEPSLTADAEALALLEQARDAAGAVEDDLKGALDGEPPYREQWPRWAPFEPALGLVGRAMARPGLRLPPTESIEDQGWGYFHLLTLHRAWLLRAWQAAEEQGPEEGAAQLLAAAAFGQRVEQASGDLIGVMVGINLQEGALEAISQLRGRAPLPEEALAALAAELATLAAGPSGITRAIAQECRVVNDLYVLMGEDPEAMMERTGDELPPLGTSMMPLFYRAEDTTALHRAWCLEVMAAAQVPAPERQWPAHVVERLAEDPPLLAMADNPVGRVLLSIAAPSFSSYAERRDLLGARYAGLRAAVAADRFAAENDRRPAQLSELVPEFLGAVPIDPVTGQPVRLEGGRILAGPADDPLEFQ